MKSHGVIKRGRSKNPRLRLAASALAKREGGKIVKIRTSELHFAFDPALAPLKADLAEHWRGIAGNKRANPKTRAEAKERLEEAEAAWLPLLEDIQRRGIIEPLMVWRRNGGGWWVKEGRNRARAARQLGLAEVPAIITREPTEDVILGTLKRGHFTKEQLAFQALTLHPYLLENAEGGRPAEAAKPHIQCVVSGTRRFASLAELAREIGCHVNTMSSAARVQRLVRSSEAARAKWVPLIFSGAGFQGILAGSGAETSGGAANGRAQAAAAARAMGWVRSFTTRLTSEWEAIERDADHLPLLVTHLRGAALSLPSLVRHELLEALRDPRKTRAALEKDPEAWALIQANYLKP